MERDKAVHFTYEELKKHGLNDWSVRLTSNINWNFLGMCIYKDKVIVLNAHHLDIHPDVEIHNTVRHEIAHALCPGERHNEVWAECAKRIGCDNTQPCSHLSFTPEIVDAIRSGATIEVTYDEQIIRTPKYKVTRLQDKCPYCGKVAQTKSENRVKISDPEKPDLMFITLECGHMITKTLPKGTPFYKFQAFGDPNCNHEWDKNTCLKCDRKRPFPFQIEGMQFAEQALVINKGVAFLDEMGLGKTVEMGGLIHFHPELQPFVAVVKSGLKFQTFKFFLDWCGIVCQIINTSSDTLIPGFKGYIISYDMMVPKTKKMKKSGKIVQMGFDIKKILEHNPPIKTIILDECQQIKNPDSSRTQQVRQLAKNRTVIALSGTPWKNRGSELFSMFNMIAPFKFPYYQRFLDTWVEQYWHGKYLKQGGIRNPVKFKEYIKDIAIRRERKDVMPELPTTQRTKLHVKFTLDEEKGYDEAVEEFAKWYEESTQMETSNAINILAKISRLRHITGAAKVPATMNYIDEFLEDNDKKIVIFVHHKDVGDSITYQCREKYELGHSDDDDDNGNGNSGPKEKIPVLQLTSDLTPIQRFEMTELFNKTPKAILIASTLASGEGLNLQTCANCVMHERQWNPANEEQAEGRFCRIGQQAPEISAVYTQVLGSIDDYLDQIVEKKRRWFHAAMNTGEAPKWNQDEILKELADVIVNNHRRKNPKRAA